jgi:sodium-dependent dicarboxylate transporter 2/3/5
MPYNEAITPSEERFERWRRSIGLFAGPLVAVIIHFLPLDLAPQAHRLASILAIVIIYWLAEPIPIPVTALLGAVLSVILGVAPAREVLEPFANQIVFLFIGSFILAESITAHGLDRRFAFAIFSLRFLQKSPLRTLFAIGAIVAAVSMWISNTAATAMMLPIALGVIGAMREMRGRKGGEGLDLRAFSTAMMLMIAYGASVGGIATPIGTPPNLIGIGMIQKLAGVRISFFGWMAFATPLMCVMFVYVFLLLGRPGAFPRPGVEGIAAYVREARAGLGGWKRGEINTAFAFGVAVLLWVAPSVSELVLGKEAAAARYLGANLNEGVSAIAAASLLFLLPVSFREMRFTLTWREAARIDWGTILLFGGGLSLGGLMFSTGLAERMGSALAALTGAAGLWSITAVATVLAIVLSETTSNTAAANMVIPVAIAIAHGAGVPPVPPALGACLGASFGFMLPVSTPPNAIVYGSGLVPILSMVRKGILLDIGGFFLIMGGLMALSPVMGWS